MRHKISTAVQGNFVILCYDPLFGTAPRHQGLPPKSIGWDLQPFTLIGLVVPVANRFFEHDVLYVVDVVLLGANRLISTGTRKDETTLDAVLLRIRACKDFISPRLLSDFVCKPFLRPVLLTRWPINRWLVTCHSQAWPSRRSYSSFKLRQLGLDTYVYNIHTCTLTYTYTCTCLCMSIMYIHITYTLSTLATRQKKDACL